MPIIITPTINGVQRVFDALKAASKAQQNAAEIALRVEGMRLKRGLAAAIRDASPGGLEFSPGTMLLRKIRHRKKALTPLARTVRYAVRKDPVEVRIGWPDAFYGMSGGVGTVSKSWRRIALRHQKGFATPVSKKQRRFFANWGAGLPKKSPFRKYFFLKRTTTQMRTPSRPIVSPFWRRELPVTVRNIADNYRRKLRGERI